MAKDRTRNNVSNEFSWELKQQATMEAVLQYGSSWFFNQLNFKFYFQKLYFIECIPYYQNKILNLLS